MDNNKEVMEVTQQPSDPPHNTETIALQPVGWVRGPRTVPADDYWRGVPSVIEFDARFSPESLLGLETFSHVEVVFHFHRVPQEKIRKGARHPRNRHDWPRVGIFAQRAKGRPNRLGVSRCRVVGVEGLRLSVLDLDAIDGTPVLDVKPWLKEYAPNTPTHQPPWCAELMTSYYNDWSDAPEGHGT
ncbi:MAG: SAM-dependent methyltransferase [Myxococcota bacterium]